MPSGFSIESFHCILYLIYAECSFSVGGNRASIDQWPYREDNVENRYALIIGINDYSTRPLSFCVNDAESIRDILINKAHFAKENVFLITSDTSNPVKNISGKLYESIEAIKSRFIENEDSIFFYFAGHGANEDGVSKVLLHDASLSIQDISQIVASCKPKMQFYVIDACESGGKTLTRKITQTQIIEDFLVYSHGVLFLYACQEDEKASEITGIKHGLMTYHFLEAINSQELYDNDGILTPGRIQEFVAKKVSSYSHFRQLPVIESRVIGYYPFITTKIPPININKDVQTSDTRNLEKFLYDIDSRLALQDLAFTKANDIVLSILDRYRSGYSINEYSNIRKMPLRNVSSLKDAIVSDASDKYESMNKIIYYKKEPYYDEYSYAMSAMLSAMGKKPEPKGYNNVPEIDVSNQLYKSIDYALFISDPYKVSFGIGVVLYQAKWGGVISPYIYKIEWDGETDSVITDIHKDNYTYLIDDASKEIIMNMELNLFNKLDSIIDGWDTKRTKEIQNFLENKK